MAYLIAGIIAFGIFQFIWSIRMAYRIERYQTAAGYPILGHALHTFCIVLIVILLVPKNWELPGIVRATLALAIIALPIVHGWLLIRYSKRGEQARLDDRKKSS